jgi:2-keto-4-pentenoate hydratase/2-oxohepta-3-ene-1,7-dioic acid hydratase in catechol pathway
MIFGFADLISHISKFMTLRTGDLIFTGTPAGVGPVVVGDELVGYIEDREMLRCRIK